MGKKKIKRRFTPKAEIEEAPVEVKKPVPRRVVALLCLVVFLLGFAVYANTLKNDFIWDDEYLIINNSQIKSFSHLDNVFKTYVGYGSENINNFYRPIQEISNMVDYFLWGLKPLGFHLTNVILHALVGVMVLLFVSAITGNVLAGFFTAVFYSIHPVHSEAVAYIAGRADSLYSVFMLLSLLCFVSSVKDTGSGLLKREGLYLLSLTFFVVSLLSKEMVMVMPLLVFMYLLIFFKGTEENDVYRTNKWRWIPYAAIIVFYGILRATILDFSKIAPASAFFKIPFIYRILTFFKTVAVYFRLLISPSDLHMERVINVSNSIFDLEALLSLLMMAGIIWVAYKAYKNNMRAVSFAIIWFFANLLPVSNIFPINSFLAEHWIYMASIGPFMLLGLAFAWAWDKVPQGGRSLKIGLALTVVFLVWLYGSVTVARNMDWRNEVSFFNSTLKYHPNNARLYLNLGNTYYEKGEVDKAIEQYLKSIKINKDYAVAYGNIGSAYLNKNDIDNAEKYLKIGIQLKDDYPIAHYNLGIIYFKKGVNDEALKELNTATRQLPQLYQAWNMMGRVYLKIGQPDAAKKAFQKSLEILPSQDNIREIINKLDKIPQRPL